MGRRVLGEAALGEAVGFPVSPVTAATPAPHQCTRLPWAEQLPGPERRPGRLGASWHHCEHTRKTRLQLGSDSSSACELMVTVEGKPSQGEEGAGAGGGGWKGGEEGKKDRGRQEEA